VVTHQLQVERRTAKAHPPAKDRCSTAVPCSQVQLKVTSH